MLPQRTFYFLRHGQTDKNLNGCYQGTCETPLNPTGVAQAHAAAAALVGAGVTRIVASPLTRALRTAAIVAERVGAPIHLDRGLRERCFGSFDGLVIREVKARHGIAPEQNSRSIMPPDADRWDEIFERVPPVLTQWLAAHPEETLLFVAHGGVFDAMHNLLLGPRTGAESRHAWPYRVAPIAGGWSLAPIESEAAPRP